jgi:hypothetical protein
LITQNTGPKDMLKAMMKENRKMVISIWKMNASYSTLSETIYNATNVAIDAVQTPFPIKSIILLPKRLIINLMIYIYSMNTLK